MALLITLTFISAITLLVRPVSSTCYRPDGTDSHDVDFQPCSTNVSSPLSTICCATNRNITFNGSDKDGLTSDKCLPNGVCLNSVYNEEDYEPNKTYTRGYCTADNWKNGKCLDICTDEEMMTNEKGPDTESWVPITPCGGLETATRWCCGFNTTDCCIPENQKNENLTVYTIAEKFGDPIPTSPSVNQSATPASSPRPNPASQRGLSAGSKAGIGLGVMLGVILLGALAFWAWKSVHWRKGTKVHSPAKEEAGVGAAAAAAAESKPLSWAAPPYAEYRQSVYAHHGATAPLLEINSEQSPREVNGLHGDLRELPERNRSQ